MSNHCPSLLLPPPVPSLSPPCFLSTPRKNRPTANGGRCIKQPPVLFKGSFTEGEAKLCVNRAERPLPHSTREIVYFKLYFALHFWLFKMFNARYILLLLLELTRERNRAVKKELKVAAFWYLYLEVEFWRCPLFDAVFLLWRRRRIYVYSFGK